MPASQPAHFNLQEFTDAGQLLVGGRLYTYAYGTTAQKTAYTDPDGTIPHTYTADGTGGQYIALNARGELPAPLYLAAGSYDISLKRDDGSTIWTRQADGVESSLVSWIASIASSLGASLIGFLQAGVGAIKRSIASKLQESVSALDFMTDEERADAVAGTKGLNLGPAIQRALDSKGSYLRVKLPCDVRSDQGLIVAGTFKVLDGVDGGAISFHGNDIMGVSVQPAVAGVQTFFSGVKNLRLFGDALTGTGNVGVKVSGTAFNVVNENLEIRYFGLAADADGYGYFVAGAPNPGDYSPQMGTHRNIRAIGNGNGILFDSGADPTGWLTQQVIEQTYTADNKGFGTQFKNVTASSMVGVSSESNGGDELVVDGGFGNTGIGGMIDGSTAFFNRDAQGRDGLWLSKIFPRRDTLFQWAQLPSAWLGDILTLKRTGIPLANMGVGETVDFTGIGVLSILTRTGAWCRVLLGTTAPGAGQFTEILEVGTTNDIWSTNSGNVGTINIYWVAAANTYRIQNLTGGGQVISIHQLVEA